MLTSLPASARRIPSLSSSSSLTIAANCPSRLPLLASPPCPKVPPSLPSDGVGRALPANFGFSKEVAGWGDTLRIALWPRVRGSSAACAATCVACRTRLGGAVAVAPGTRGPEALTALAATRAPSTRLFTPCAA